MLPTKTKIQDLHLLLPGLSKPGPPYVNPVSGNGSKHQPDPSFKNHDQSRDLELADSAETPVTTHKTHIHTHNKTNKAREKPIPHPVS